MDKIQLELSFFEQQNVKRSVLNKKCPLQKKNEKYRKYKYFKHKFSINTLQNSSNLEEIKITVQQNL
jgi:hypothetical protein